jgi:hypothetical protein
MYIYIYIYTYEYIYMFIYVYIHVYIQLILTRGPPSAIQRYFMMISDIYINTHKDLCHIRSNNKG